MLSIVARPLTTSHEALYAQECGCSVNRCACSLFLPSYSADITTVSRLAVQCTQCGHAAMYHSRQKRDQTVRDALLKAASMEELLTLKLRSATTDTALREVFKSTVTLLDDLGLLRSRADIAAEKEIHERMRSLMGLCDEVERRLKRTKLPTPARGGGYTQQEAQCGQCGEYLLDSKSAFCGNCGSRLM